MIATPTPVNDRLGEQIRVNQAIAKSWEAAAAIAVHQIPEIGVCPLNVVSAAAMR